MIQCLVFNYDVICDVILLYCNFITFSSNLTCFFTRWLSLMLLFKIIRGTLSKKYFFWFHVLFFTCEVNLVYILHFASSSPFWASWLHFYEMINMVEFVLKSKSNILDEWLLILCLAFFNAFVNLFCYISIFCNFITILTNLAFFTKWLSWLKLFRIIRK